MKTFQYIKEPSPIPIKSPIPIRFQYIKEPSPIPIRFCGAEHEMIAIEPSGEILPCQRFSKWITNKLPPSNSINNQNYWKSDKCNQCKLIPICPTCAGYNWQMNNDTAERTTYHCEAFKLEVLASAKLQAIKLEKKIEELSSLSQKDIYIISKKINSIIELNKTIM